MKQVLIRGGGVAVEDVPAPAVGSRSILVRVEHSVVSAGTELSSIRMSALPLYRRALASAPVPEYAVALGDLLAALKRPEQAAVAYARAAALEDAFARNGGQNQLETALVDLDHDRNLSDALARAREGRRLRPSIEGDHVLAWALYKNGRCADARRYSQRALRLGTKDIGAIYHRSLIERCLGNDAAAERFLDRVRVLDPYFLRVAPSAFRLR